MEGKMPEVTFCRETNVEHASGNDIESWGKREIEYALSLQIPFHMLL